MDLWQLPVIEGPLPGATLAVAAALFIVVAVRRWRRRALIWALASAGAGAVIGYLTCKIVSEAKVFGTLLPPFVWHWVVPVFAAVGFVLGALQGTRAWRKVVSVAAAVAILVAGALGVNLAFGLNPTLGSVVGVAQPEIEIPAVEASSAAPSQPLYQTWTPPAGMALIGKRGSQIIPATSSGFAARPAGIYLPPAALVKDPPALPLVIMMMGHPGTPDPTSISSALDGFAAHHQGLAPIVIVPDQLGENVADTACADSDAYGKARTYVTVDVVAWAKAHLNVIQDPAYWTIAGYSNGGGCAITFGAQSPQLWKNILDISGEPYPGSEQPANITKIIYGGNASAFEASKPVNILAAAAPGSYQGMNAILTAGGADPEYIKGADMLAKAAGAVGMNVVRYNVPGAGHTGDALKGGLAEGIRVLYPILGLSAP
ncbi:alpha/beta hydrolase [Microbacterium dextranolyticum]|uniref:Esterase n=1 Tax=Microbacterium dextranolyticum TaxID=36806 RepID=A0A9W6HKN4_9MICO|nr:alpha/beta hydrolase-fold protein [Microbacterium dextranolyticum]MBM7462268.1 enterochelin esterase-like enzyme [Microbacterium dextranolyticum]GLJ94519.1 esterase [Microbacterium dextranolyticum]